MRTGHIACIVFCVAAAIVACGCKKSPQEFSPGKQGETRPQGEAPAAAQPSGARPSLAFIQEWLVCGPFPSPKLTDEELGRIAAARKDDPNVKYLRGGHRVDYLQAAGGEAAVRPTKGQEVKPPDGPVVKWQTYKSPGPEIWFHEVFGKPGFDAMVAYAYTTIRRPKAVQAHLSLGSDDSIKVYLNGKLVHDAHVAHPLKADQYKVPVTLHEGENTLLIKVENALGTGGFIIRPLQVLPNGRYLSLDGEDLTGPGEFPGAWTVWKGFNRYDFEVDTRKCIVVTPRKAAPGKPWIWRARYFGHEPQTDVALLNKGFHLVYMDVGSLAGSDEAVAHWDKFYEFLTTKHGLSKKAALEGMSAGGLFIYNWGGRNPDKVTCIYGDAPLCNFKATRGFEEGEPRVDNKYLIEVILRPLAEAGVPLIHVCGDADKAVDVNAHTRVLEKRYKELGGTIKVIIKPGVGHHPHSLEDPTPIVDFILEATRRAGST